MTILEHFEDLEEQELRLLGSVMLAEAITESHSETEDIHLSRMVQELGVERETSERLAVLQTELAALLEAGCGVREASYLTKRSPYLAARSEGGVN